MSEYVTTRDYPDPPRKIWAALTDPVLVPLWTSTGRGGRPVGFEPRVGVRFQYIGRPVPGWDGRVDCRVLEVIEPSLLRFSWIGSDKAAVTTVAVEIESVGRGSRLTWRHSGFTGLSGRFMTILLSRVRQKMFSTGLPPVLAQLADDGRPLPGNTLGLPAPRESSIGSPNAT